LTKKVLVQFSIATKNKPKVYTSQAVSLVTRNILEIIFVIKC